MKKPVAQEDDMGCGVACVAFLLGKEYQQILKLFDDGKSRANTTGFYSKELTAVLDGYKCGFVKRNKHRIYTSGAIVFLKRGGKYLKGHYVVRYVGKWMDPWINFPRLPIKAGYRKRLPEMPVYVIYKK